MKLYIGKKTGAGKLIECFYLNLRCFIHKCRMRSLTKPMNLELFSVLDSQLPLI